MLIVMNDNILASGVKDELLVDLSVAVYVLVMDKGIPVSQVKEAVNDGVNKVLDDLKSKDVNALKKYLAELSSRVLGDPS